MSPDERQLGILIGTVESLGKQIDEMKRENAADHKEVLGALNELRTEVAKKASEDRVRDVEGRTDKLESRSDKLMAIIGLAFILAPFIVGLLGLLTGGGS